MIKEFDVVLTKSGKCGTILEVHPDNKESFLIEFTDSLGEVVTIQLKEIEEVIYSANKEET